MRSPFTLPQRRADASAALFHRASDGGDARRWCRRSSIRCADAGNVVERQARRAAPAYTPGARSSRRWACRSCRRFLRAAGWPQTDRACDLLADILADTVFDPLRQASRIARWSSVSSMQVSSSIDFTVSIGNLAGDFIQQRVMGAPEQIRPLRDEDEVGHKALASGTRMTFLQPAAFASLEQAITTVDVRCRGVERDHANGFAPQMRHRLLHDRGEEAVEIEVQSFRWSRPSACAHLLP